MVERTKTFEMGNKQTGYTVSYDILRRRLDVEMRGNWRDDSMAMLFMRDVRSAISALVELGEWDVCADLTTYELRIMQVQKIIRELMIFALKNRFRKGGVAITDRLTQTTIGAMADVLRLNLRFYRSKTEAEVFLREPNSVSPSR